MASSSSQNERLLRLFLEEAQEHLLVMNGALLEIEARRGERAEHLSAILRAAHSIKGAASAAGLSRVSAMLHNWESCAQTLSSREDVDVSALELLYRSLDAIEGRIQEDCTGTRAKLSAPGPNLTELRTAFGEAVDLLDVESDAVPIDPSLAPESAPPFDDVGSIRVATDKIQRLMSGVEDLVAIKSGGDRRSKDVRELETRLERAVKLAGRIRTEVRDSRTGGTILALIEELHGLLGSTEDFGSRLSLDVRRHTHGLDALATRLQDDIRSVRMIPIEQAFAALPRLVRDVSRKLGKSVEYQLEGGNTEIDRDLVDVMKDPVMHLIRNAIAHGIESDEIRRASDKPVPGVVRVEAVSRAGGLQLSIRDDGAGIDLERVRRIAVEKGLFGQSEADLLDRQQLTQLLFRAGFSTAHKLDEVSGRGVGLDVVRQQVEGCGGSVILETSPGIGTEFAVRLPLNLTSMRMLLTRVGSEQFALPINAVLRVMRVHRQHIRQVDTGLVCEVEGKPVPIERLSRMLNVQDQVSASDKSPGIVISSGASQAMLLVDAIEGEHELIVKSLGDHLGRVQHVAGATVLASGRIVPLLNVGDIVQQLVGARQAKALFVDDDEAQRKRHRVLIVDDSITTRTLESSILEAVGYEVDVATDGVDALSKLSQSHFDLVLSDFQMPRMDGLELASRIKGDPALHQIPVILVSSLASEDDRARGLKAGADAYLGKGEFSQELLLKTLERFL